MLVVDRRAGEEAETYDPTATYGAVQATLEKHISQSTIDVGSHFIPAQVEVETPPKGPKHPPGTPVIVQTPGPVAILKLLAERVWGVNIA